MRYWWIILNVFCFCAALHAQTDTLHTSGPEVIILLNEEEGQSLKSGANSIRLIDQLRTQTGVVYRNNGPAYFSSALNRGQDAKHLAILWEGINIQNSINGTYDLGLLAAPLWGNSRYYATGNSAAIGNASLGGAIELGGTASNMIGLHWTSIASDDAALGLSDMYFSGQWRKGRLSQQINISHTNTANAYSYRWYDGSEKKRLHNAQKQFDIRYKLALIWNEKRSTQLNVWWQDADRQLPGSITSLSANETQTDINQRISFRHIEQLSDIYTWQTQWAYMDEYLGYFTPSVDSRANNYIHLFSSKLQREEGPNTQRLGLQYRTDRVKANFFEDRFTRKIFSTYFYWGRDLNNGKWEATLRQEIVDGQWQSPVLHAQYRHDWSKHVSSTLSLSNHNNYPTFNDLYWPTGGNIYLKKEYSNQVNASLDIYGFRIASYYIYTKDKIVWRPTPSGFWSPTNINESLSYGIDLSWQYQLQWQSLSFELEPHYYYLLAREKGSDKRLPYIPDHKATMDVNLAWRSARLGYAHTWVSSRNTPFFGLASLPSYNYGEIMLSADIALSKNRKIELHAKVNNALNEEYELTSYFPQPLRNYQLGIKFNY